MQLKKKTSDFYSLQIVLDNKDDASQKSYYEGGLSKPTFILQKKIGKLAGKQTNKIRFKKQSPKVRFCEMYHKHSTGSRFSNRFTICPSLSHNPGGQQELQPQHWIASRFPAIAYFSDINSVIVPNSTEQPQAKASTKQSVTDYGHLCTNAAILIISYSRSSTCSSLNKSSKNLQLYGQKAFYRRIRTAMTDTLGVN